MSLAPLDLDGSTNGSRPRTSSLPPALAARLDDPAVADALGTLLDHADLLAVLLAGMDGLVRRSETIGESLAGGLTDLKATLLADDTLGGTGLDLGELVRSLATLATVLPTAAPGMAAAVESGAIDKVFASDLVTPEAVDQVSLLARGLVRGSRRWETDPVTVSGPLSLLRLLKDPDVSRALGYVVTVAQAIGQELDPARATTPSTGA